MPGELQAVRVINLANAVQNELTIIVAGLEELKPLAGSLSENEWLK